LGIASSRRGAQAARELEPASVLVSRKTQRLYVRQAFEPLFESPVTILDSDRPIGTHVFTAMEQTSGDDNIRRSVVSLQSARPHDSSAEPHRRSAGADKDFEPMVWEPNDARAARDRIAIRQDALDRIPGMVPRSSLIVTDEALSSETGKGTEFVVLLSDEPQGGIKMRRRGPGANSATRANLTSYHIGARPSRIRFDDFFRTHSVAC
jgi:hypothetical protein